ncbi:DNA adenine methylase [Spongiactinospora sp. 9N601]|uniref:DNA adenine methylase n=1 Tax=Spongiactinospora sp. 9N601 TaxID=3375149 RepID=UPI00378E0FB3
MALRPPFAYYGAEGRLAPLLAGLLPPHEVYVEPFAGVAAVLFAKRPAQGETINDINGDLMAFMRALRDQPRALIRAFGSPRTPPPSIRPRASATPPRAIWNAPAC